MWYKEGKKEMEKIIIEKKEDKNKREKNGINKINLWEKEEKVNVEEVIVKKRDEIDKKKKDG